MRAWILSDLHLEKRPPLSLSRPEFDCLICAGDIWNEIGQSISTVARLADGRPVIFVAGNHEYWSDDDPIEIGRILAEHEGVHLLECETVTVGDITFAGATLWEPDHSRFMSSVSMLTDARADVVVTHYPPTPQLLSAIRAPLWIYGHVHGHRVVDVNDTRTIRNALGYPGERYATEDGAVTAPFDSAFVVQIRPRSARGRDA